MLKRSALVILVLAVAAFGLFAGGAREAAAPETGIQELEISIGSAFPEGSEVYQAAVVMKQLIEERSEGNITVNNFLGGAVGNEEAVAEAVSIGSLEGQSSGFTFISMFAPQYNFFDIPFSILSFDHWWAVWNSGLGDEMRQEVLNNGNFYVVAALQRGQRHMFAKKPVRSPEDMRGVRQRVPSIEEWVMIWEQGIGSSATGVSMTEIYTALQTGVVDAIDADLSAGIGYRHYETTTHLSLTAHQPMMGYISFNRDFLDGLNAETRDLIVTAAEDAAAMVTESAMADQEEYVETLRANGMQIVELTPQQRQRLQDAAEPVLRRIFDDKFAVSRDDVLALAP